MRYFLGVDPGWTNLAYAWIDEDLNIIKTGCIVPSTLPKGMYAADLIHSGLLEGLGRSSLATMKEWVSGAGMERFVYFKGVHNPNSEQILMVTGQTQYWMKEAHGIVPRMHRSFDWKSALAKHLYKQGFRNPSETLDKEFSIAAAEFVFKSKFKTDHEADAACLAYIARLEGGDGD